MIALWTPPLTNKFLILDTHKNNLPSLSYLTLQKQFNKVLIPDSSKTVHQGSHT